MGLALVQTKYKTRFVLNSDVTSSEIESDKASGTNQCVRPVIVDGGSISTAYCPIKLNYCTII